MELCCDGVVGSFLLPGLSAAQETPVLLPPALTATSSLATAATTIAATNPEFQLAQTAELLQSVLQATNTSCLRCLVKPAFSGA